MIRVRFAKGWRMYQPGEIAAFDEATVKQLVAAGIASVFDEKAEAAAAKAAAKAEAAAKAKAEEEAKAKAEADAQENTGQR